MGAVDRRRGAGARDVVALVLVLLIGASAALEVVSAYQEANYVRGLGGSSNIVITFSVSVNSTTFRSLEYNLTSATLVYRQSLSGFALNRTIPLDVGRVFDLAYSQFNVTLAKVPVPDGEIAAVKLTFSHGNLVDQTGAVFVLDVSTTGSLVFRAPFPVQFGSKNTLSISIRPAVVLVFKTYQFQANFTAGWTGIAQKNITSIASGSCSPDGLCVQSK